MQFDEKKRLIIVLCLDRNCQDDLALVFFTLNMRTSKIKIRFGIPFACRKDRSFDPRNVNRHFSRALKQASLPHQRFHDLRHGCATLLLAQGVHPRVVMDILGHSQISLTMDTYSHVIPELQQQAASEMDSILTG